MEEFSDIYENLIKEKRDLCILCQDMGLNLKCDSCLVAEKICLSEGNQFIVFEKKLMDMANLIRREWLCKVNSDILTMYRSPNQREKKYPSFYYENAYTYERCFIPTTLEQKVNAEKKICGWDSETLLFSSAMMGINCILQVIKYLYSNTQVNLFMRAKYYETVKIVKLMLPDSTCIKSLDEYILLGKPEINIIFLEATVYDISLKQEKYQDILTMLLELERDNPIFIIFDVTLVGDFFDLKNFLDICKIRTNVFVIVIESLLKLSQQGLELSNCGRMTIYNLLQNKKDSDKILYLLREYRMVIGGGLSFQQAMLLNFGKFASDRFYVKSILENNANFATLLSQRKGKSIHQVIHPVLNDDGGDCPFLFLVLSEKSCLDVLKFIINYFEKIGLPIEVGDSFGFRSCRIEIIDFCDSENLFIKKKIIKIAVGKICGFQYKMLLELFCKI